MIKKLVLCFVFAFSVLNSYSERVVMDDIREKDGDKRSEVPVDVDVDDGQDAFDDILDSLRIKTKSEVNVDYVNAFDSISLAVMKDPSFNQSYEEMLNIVSTKSPKEFIQASGVTYDEVVRLYLDILNTSPEKLEDVEFITNKYIELIEKSNELTEAEKDNIYMAFSVAAASVEYWNKNYTE